jgi:hypothetical protein
VRRGASWTAAYHLQLTVAAVARPVRSSVRALRVLAAERSWLLLAQTASARRSVQPVARGRRRRRGRHCQQPSHGVGRRCPAGGVHPSGFGVRDPAVQPSGVRSPGVDVQRVRRSAVCCPPVQRPAVCCPPVRCPAVWCLPPSIRTRPYLPLRRWRWRPGRGGRATVTTGTGGDPVAAGRRRLDQRVQEAGTRATLPSRVGQWEVGGGPGPPGWVRAAAAALARCATRQAKPAIGAPSRRLRCGLGSRLQREVAAPAAWLPSSGWVRDHGAWSSPSLTPGWADPEGPLDAPAGIGVRPQRGPSRQPALLARSRQRSDLRRWVVGLPGLEPGTSSLSAKNLRQ